MLQAESTASRAFPQGRVLDAIAGEIEDSARDRVELSVSFSHGTDPATSTTVEACKACGNCFSGCPYNAKMSLDKNYIAAAAKVGCAIHTNCEVRFILPNFHHPHKAPEVSYSQNGHRRWRVYLDDVRFITADFVVIAAGVVGTTTLLYQSKMRGLAVSDRLGHGLSCNGNNIAIVCGTHVTTRGHSLTSNEVVEDKVGFDRPGPSITTSYTSSLGYTIQGAILPNAFSIVLFKCLSQCGFWFGLLYGLCHKIKRVLNLRNGDSLAFNMMGHDGADGRMQFDPDRSRVRFFPPTDPLIPKKIHTMERITKRIGGRMFMSAFRNTVVHLLGGCNAGRNSKDSVANPSGQIFSPFRPYSTSRTSLCTGDQISDAADLDDNLVHDGLYVCDASLIPCAVGVNPSLTITTIAEHVARGLVDNATSYYSQKGFRSTGDRVTSVMKNSHESFNNINGENRIIMSGIGRAAGVRVWETLSGSVEGLPCRLEIVMDLGSAQSNHGILRGQVGGRFKMDALETGLLHIVDGTVDMCFSHTRTPFSQYMFYKLLLVSENGAMYEMLGKKEMKPFWLGLTALTESRTLELELNVVSNDLTRGTTRTTGYMTTMRGTVQISFINLLLSLISMKGPRKFDFVSSLLLSLFRTYFLSTSRLQPSFLENYGESQQYPQYTVHDMVTDDGARISCWRWPPSPKPNDVSKTDFSSSCVLLLNGYSGESYCLPTEDNDLVRTLLNSGYEVWLLHTRLHFSVCTNNPFSLDDIVRFDLPAAFAGMAELRSKVEPIHVVAHCIGGLIIHMALLGGYVPVSSVASLTCTNSSMFFDVTKLAMVKLFLPLIPVSLWFLGANSVICFSDNSPESWRHRLLKRALCLVPRLEKCTCKECDLFSGMFGNAFWHENVTERLHAWLSKEALVRLPVSGFRQLRQICMAGTVVGSNGEGKYMPYIGRLTLPTTYISGGRSLLVTPNTTERAHALMRHHHPEFNHTRHLVYGYGHSDLLIGEMAPRDVFPLILGGISKSAGAHSGSTSLSPHTIEIQRETWVIPPSQATAFLRSLKIYFLLTILVIVLFCIS
ncbi:hypothetical protein KP509_01G107600 [Ceratopteris richardii]|nr:hypothetical protein KP509_01G107600 [Ceratopteris richardii]